MGNSRHFSWLVSPKSFIQLIGAEYEILKKSGSASLIKFYIAAVVILFIFLISACSIFYAMELLFHILHVEIIMASFISILFVFIYIFLLNTFSKNIFKQQNSIEKNWFRKFTLTNIIRTGFILFMAFLISKPIEAFLFQKPLSEKVGTHRIELLNAYNTRLEKLNQKDMLRLQASIRSWEEKISRYSSPAMQQELETLHKKVNQIQDEQVVNLQNASFKIAKSDFLLFRIKQVAKKPLAWAVCLFMIALFLLPGFLIYSISDSDSYYKLKQEYEKNLVLEEYRVFETEYTTLFDKGFQLQRVYHTKFMDPPFNNILKPDPHFKSQKDFLGNYSGE